MRILGAKERQNRFDRIQNWEIFWRSRLLLTGDRHTEHRTGSTRGQFIFADGDLDYLRYAPRSPEFLLRLH